MLTSLIFSSVIPAVHAETPKENVIIVFKDDINQKAVTNVNGEIEEVLNHIPVITGEIPEAAIPILERNKEILTVEVDQRVQVNGQVQDWGIKAVNAEQSWQSTYTGKGIKVAVLDTGISPHEDLMIAGGVSFTSYTTSYFDDNGHGTHVAGIIGAENHNNIGTVGVAPDADLFAVKVLDRNGSGYLSDIIKGIDWSMTNKMDIINLSLGIASDSLALHQAVDKAYNSGILLVAAAGNNGKVDGTGDTVEYPARYDSTIAVSAMDTSNMRGSFSATGQTIEVTAPGVKILSTYLNNQYLYMSGTSMAAPYAAGTLALLKQANPALSHTQLREKLNETVKDIGATGKDTFFGNGLIQTPIQIQETQVTEAPTTQEKAVTTKPQVQPVKQPVKSSPKPTVKKPVGKKNLTSTVTTARSTYSAGHTAWINVKAVDKITKKPIVNATVKLTITPPKGKKQVVTLKTNKKGEASYKFLTNKRTTKGTYKFSTSTSVANYHVASASKTIRIK